MDKNRGPIGPVSHFAESDYRYGSGSLAMRVDRVDWTRPVQVDGETWYEIDGVEVTSDGREVGRRQALVRGRRLTAPPKNARS